MDQLGAAERGQGIPALEDVEDQAQGQAAGGNRRHRVDRVSAVADLDRLSPHRRVVLEVLVREETSAPLHLGHDQVGDPTAIETVRALLRDRLKRGRKVRLLQHRARRRRLAVDQELHRTGRKPLEPRRRRFETPGSRLVDFVAPGQLHSRRDQVAPGQGSERPVHLPKTCHRTRDAGREVADHRALRDLALIIQEHVAGRGAGRLLAVVQGPHFAVAGSVHEEPAAADVAGRGQDRCQREADGYRGVDRVSALLKDRGADIRGEAMAADDHAVRAFSRWRRTVEMPGRRSRTGFWCLLGPRAGKSKQDRDDQSAGNRSANERTRGNGREPAHRGGTVSKRPDTLVPSLPGNGFPYTGEEPCRPSSPS